MSFSTTPMRGANPTWKPIRQKAGAQLGTVGSGNHYVDLMRDEDGFVWIGVHFWQPRPGAHQRDPLSQGGRR